MKSTKQLALRWIFTLFCLVAVRASDTDRQNQGNLRRNDDHKSQSNTHATADLSSLLNMEMTPEETASLQTPINSNDIDEVDVSSLQFINLAQIALLAHRTALEQQILDEINKFEFELGKLIQKTSVSKELIDLQQELSRLWDLKGRVLLEMELLQKNKGVLSDKVMKESSKVLEQIEDRILQTIIFWESTLNGTDTEAKTGRELVKEYKKGKVMSQFFDFLDWILIQFDRVMEEMKNFIQSSFTFKEQYQKLDDLEKEIDSLIAFMIEKEGYFEQQFKESNKAYLLGLVDNIKKTKFHLLLNEKQKEQYQRAKKMRNQLERKREGLMQEQLAKARKLLDLSRQELNKKRKEVQMKKEEYISYSLTRIPVDLDVISLIQKSQALSTSQQQKQYLQTIISKLREWNQKLVKLSVFARVGSKLTYEQRYYLMLSDLERYIAINGQLLSQKIELNKAGQLNKQLLSQITKGYILLMERVHWIKSFTQFQFSCTHREFDQAKKDKRSSQPQLSGQSTPVNENARSILVPIDSNKRYFRKKSETASGKPSIQFPGNSK